MYIDSWSNEPGVDWSSLYNPAYSIGKVTNTDTFDLDDTVRKISDTADDVVRIYHTDKVSYTDYDVVPADTLKQYYYGQNKENPTGRYCAQIGTTIVFNHTFKSTDPQFGGDIKVPIYTYPDHLVGDNDDVPVTIANWLVVICAAEWVRNDITRQNQYPNLIGEANQVMIRMKEDNDAQVERVDRPWSVVGQTWQ